ncbi:MAG: hypothetical protein H6633_15300 [Anaerolineales bacterium]|nr:hypothetical protein [Anaerolineales bacterium]
MDWLDYLPQSERYSESWGQIHRGLETLQWMQEYGITNQFKEGHFHRTYVTVKSDDTDEEQQNIKTQTGKDIQSSDDNALPFMNLLILEGLAQDPSVHIPDSADIVRLCQEIRSAINLKRFVINDRIIHNYTNGDPMGEWDRISAEGAIILMALMLSNQITQQEFEDIAASLKNHLVNWDSLDSG